MADKPAKDFIASIARCIEVILSFDRGAAALTPAEAAAKTGLSRAAARRILLTLAALGYAVTDGKRFRLTPKILDLGRGYLASMQTAEAMQPLIDAAAAKVRETCAVCVLDGAEIVTIACSKINPIDTLHIDVGSRFPAHYSSIGRCILASLPEPECDTYIAKVKLAPPTPKAVKTGAELKTEIEKARRQQYSIVDGELRLGIFTIAVPLRNGAGKVFAGVNFGGNVARINRKNIRGTFLPLLRELTQRIQGIMPQREVPLR